MRLLRARSHKNPLLDQLSVEVSRVMVYTLSKFFMNTSRFFRVLFCFTLLLTMAIGCRSVHPGRMAYNVRAFGAKGDGKTLDHLAINRAIAAAARMGGGTVVVPPGVYLCGSIHLQSNIHLDIEAGAIILGAPQKLNAYDLTEPR